MTPPRNSSRNDRDAVARAALHLLDEGGLADLSMRRIAARLDVQPSALYWHFENKQELLAELADRITSRIPCDGASVIDVARSIRDALFAYRDGAELVLSTYALRLGSSHAQHALEEALVAAGTPDPRERAAAILHFTLGHSTLAQQRMHAESYGAAGSGEDDPTRGLNEVFELGIRALSQADSPELSESSSPRRDRA